MRWSGGRRGWDADGSWDQERGFKRISEEQRPFQHSWQPTEGCAAGLPGDHRKEIVDSSKIQNKVKEVRRWGGQLECSTLNLQGRARNRGMKGACQAPSDSAEGDQRWNYDSVNSTDTRSRDCDGKWLTAISPGGSPNAVSLCHADFDTLKRFPVCHCCCHLHHEHFYKAGWNFDDSIPPQEERLKSGDGGW